MNNKFKGKTTHNKWIYALILSIYYQSMIGPSEKKYSLKILVCKHNGPFGLILDETMESNKFHSNLKINKITTF